MSFTKVRDARIRKLVIPAQAGIHWLLLGNAVRIDHAFSEA
jgi:hypothetical protein